MARVCWQRCRTVADTPRRQIRKGARRWTCKMRPVGGNISTGRSYAYVWIYCPHDACFCCRYSVHAYVPVLALANPPSLLLSGIDRAQPSRLQQLVPPHWASWRCWPSHWALLTAAPASALLTSAVMASRRRLPQHRLLRHPSLIMSSRVRVRVRGLRWSKATGWLRRRPTTQMAAVLLLL